MWGDYQVFGVLYFGTIYFGFVDSISAGADNNRMSRISVSDMKYGF